MPKGCIPLSDKLPEPRSCVCSGNRCGAFIADKHTDFFRNRQGEAEPFAICQKCRVRNNENLRKSNEAKKLKVIADREYAVEQERLAGVFSLAQAELKADKLREERVATDKAIRLQRQKEVSTLPQAPFLYSRFLNFFSASGRGGRETSSR